MKKKFAGLKARLRNIFGRGRIFGIDVSHHQLTINWNSVKSAAVVFAFIKATEGSSFTDAFFAANRRKAKSIGIFTSAYHFFHPHTPVQAQVSHFLSVVGKIEVGELPPMLDIENPDEWINVPVAQRGALVLAWCSAVKTAVGLAPIIYLSPSMANDILHNTPELAQYPLFIAHYTSAPKPSVPKPWRTWTFWQYSRTGRVAGISGDVDVDSFSGTLAELNMLRKR